jgi:methionyl-tRNA synthetase
MFPAMLQAHNRALGLKEGDAGAFVGVDNVPANEFLNLEGQKISTSRNWAVWLHEYLEELPGREDELRYVLCATAPETKDNDFTWADYQNRVNGELVAVLGNFVNRAVTLVHKWHGGHVPAAHLSHEGKAFLSEVAAQPAKIAEAIEGFRFREALQSLMEMARLGNRYLAEHEPWKLIKTDASRADAVLVAALQASAMIGLAARPFMPAMAEKLCRMLKLEASALPWLACTASDHLEEGLLLGPAELLFQKVEDETVDAQRAKLKAMAAAATSPAAEESSQDTSNKTHAHKPLQPLITYDDFAKLDLRVGVIVAAEKVKGADKLLKLTLNASDLDDAGAPRERIVVSGIAEHFAPEAIIGQQVVVLANLAPRKLRGIESEGMILMAETANGGLAFVAPSEVVLPGAGVR